MVMEQSDGEGSNWTGCIQDDLENMLFIVGSETFASAPQL